MARNRVPFQRGMRLSAFQRLWGSEAQCRAALVRMRWPSGLVCPHCGERRRSDWAPKRVFRCRACRVRTSARAGTILHKSRTPPRTWFLAMHLVTSAKNDVARLERSRQLDVKWDAAWLIRQKPMGDMFRRDSIYTLEGDIQIDDADQGGEQLALPGKTGRAARQGPFRVGRPDA